MREGIGLLIDDGPLSIEGALQRGIVAATIWHPWNEEVCDEEDVICAGDWQELARLLEPVSGHPRPRREGGRGEQGIGPRRNSMVMAADEEGRGAPASQWAAALELLQEDLRRRDAAARTRRAYAVDLGQFARWARARRLTPADVGVRDVRRYVARLSEAGAAPASTARKLAAVRGLFCQPARARTDREQPGRPGSDPAPPSRLPRVLKASGGGAAAGEHPGAARRCELRDRAMFELAYACGLRAEELVTLEIDDVDYDGEQVRVEGKGRKTRYVPVGELAMVALRDYLRAGPRQRSCTAGAGAPAVKSGRPLTPATCAGACACGRRAPGWPARAIAAHPPPQLRDASARRRRGPAEHPGAARPRQRLDYAGLHSGRVRAG